MIDPAKLAEFVAVARNAGAIVCRPEDHERVRALLPDDIRDRVPFVLAKRWPAGEPEAFGPGGTITVP